MSAGPLSSTTGPSLKQIIRNSQDFSHLFSAIAGGKPPPGCRSLKRLVSHPRYRHHLNFLRPFLDENKSVWPLIYLAKSVLTTTIPELSQNWDGGGHSRYHWDLLRNYTINNLCEGELSEQTIPLILTERGLFDGNVDEPEVLRTGLHRKADQCFEAILNHLVATAHCAVPTQPRRWSRIRQSLLRRAA